MIKHVVMWKFKADKKEEMGEFLSKLEGLKGQINVLKSLETGININEKNDCDAVLITTFDSLDDLEKYKNDPRHLAVSSRCKSIRTERHSVDYII